MSRDSGPKSISKNSPKAHPKLKLVVSNPNPAPASPSIQRALPVSLAAPPKEGFSVKTANKGHHLYEMRLQDPSHYLSCVLGLEVEESYGIEEGIADGSVICYFPPIEDELLNEFIEGNETLYGLLIVQFQMKILQELLLFCATHYASQLIIYMDDAQAEKFGIYENFLSHYGRTLTPSGEKTEMAIPADPETCDKWTGFMDETSQNFRKTLWRDKVFTPVIRSYLKWDPVLQFFS